MALTIDWGPLQYPLWRALDLGQALSVARFGGPGGTQGAAFRFRVPVGVPVRL